MCMGDRYGDSLNLAERELHPVDARAPTEKGTRNEHTTKETRSGDRQGTLIPRHEVPERVHQINSDRAVRIRSDRPRRTVRPVADHTFLDCTEFGDYSS